MKNLLIATMLTSVAMAGTAYAQTTAPEAPANEPAMESEGADAGSMGGMANEGGFITYQEGSQMLGSGLMGADVQGADGESIGSVDDLLLDNQGQVQAIVVGVGGFLGIGTKDVAIATDQLEFVMAEEAAAMDDTAAQTTAPADAGATPAPSGTTTETAPATGTTGTMGGTAGTGTGTMAQSGEGWGWDGAGIDHIMVNYTREQLEEAPEFESAE